MPRTQPTTHVDVMGKLEVDLVKDVGDYIESKKLHATKTPNWDSAGDSIELMAIANTREHDTMLQVQAEMHENISRQNAANSRRTQFLYHQQDQLRRRFVEVNNFIRECMDKRIIAEKKIIEEEQKHTEYRIAIARCKNNIEELKKFKRTLIKTYLEYDPYEEVMNEVLEESHLFESHKDCMDRCDALMMAYVEIYKLNHEKLGGIQEIHKKMVKIIKEAKLTIMGLQNELSYLDRSYTAVYHEVMRWERTFATAKANVLQNDTNKDRMLDGIQHIYRLLCKHKNIEPVYSRNEVEKQLDFIRNEVEILNHVIYECETNSSNRAGIGPIKERKIKFPC